MTGEIMELESTKKKTVQQDDVIFALDIGTRTVVGILGKVINDKFTLIDCVVEPHTKRAMIDGQIEDIAQVAKIITLVKEKLEDRNGIVLKKASIAAAGRALKTVRVSQEYDISDKDIITAEVVSALEMETIQAAQAEIDAQNGDKRILFYCVGHNVVSYRLDDYAIMSLVGHKGSNVGIDMVVAFLPSVVVEGLYSAMELVGLEVHSLTLEPIAAMNVIVPREIRLINIALVDIGAGTSDIAISKDGAIVAYAMATTAGDEITEEIIRTYLVDFNTAENMKHLASAGKPIVYSDIFGLEHEVSKDEFDEKISPCVETLADTICKAIKDINVNSPAAVFLVGGGSLTKDLPKHIAQRLDLDENHVAVGNSRFVKDVDLSGFELGAEYITPVGIGLTASVDAGYDFSVITINGEKIRVFDTKQLEVFQLLNLAGYRTAEIMGHSGRSLTFTLNSNRTTLKGEPLVPAEISVNGKPASLTTKVTQGDNVELTPAKSGENAHAKLSEVIDYSRFESGRVKIGDKELPFGVEVFVNGEKKAPDYEIQPLDEITTGGILTLSDLLSSLDTDFENNIAVNGEFVGAGYILRNGDRIELVSDAEPEIYEDEIPEGDWVTVPDSFMNKQSVSVNEAAVVAEHKPQVTQEIKPQLVTETKPQDEKKFPGLAITLHLNGSQITLPKLPEPEEPHRFFELFNHIEIDTQTPKDDVVLTLNGNIANFNDILSNGDRAVITWKEL